MTAKTSIKTKTPHKTLKEEHNHEIRVVLTTGLALFAMFFGAGNIVFPLFLGANTGQNLSVSAIGFLLAGVGVPILGLVATSLYQGNYEDFFNRLGKVPGFLIITFLMIIIGPLVAMPRTEATTFHALLPYLPDFLQKEAIFSLIYCSVVFILAYRESSIINILGLVLSPVKIISFTILVIVGLLFSEPPIVSALSSLDAFKLAIMNGYNTMDLLATFFYCSVAFTSIEEAIKKDPHLNATKMTLKSCLLGAFITGLVYMGFMLVSYAHAQQLHSLPEEQMIAATSNAVLGKFGGIFVCISVSFACVATALALAEVTRLYLYEEIFRHKVSKNVCLVIVMVLTYLMTNLGFQGILKMSLPILNIIYPALIVLCIMNILYKWKGIKMVKFPVALTMIICAIIQFAM